MSTYIQSERIPLCYGLVSILSAKSPERSFGVPKLSHADITYLRRFGADVLNPRPVFFNEGNHITTVAGASKHSDVVVCGLAISSEGATMQASQGTAAQGHR